uniref:Fibronectin type-III domain-containing protein n=1 Tax=Knipowitschia caucasica TaxID=637954 RepID=A0AAV2L077_KNICA
MATAFNLQAFVLHPSAEALELCKKKDLFEVADHFEILYSRQSSKAELKVLLLDGLVERGLRLIPEAERSDESIVHATTPRRTETPADGPPGAEREFVEGDARPEPPRTPPRYGPPSPAPSSRGSVGGARRALRLARIKMEAEQKDRDRSAELELHIRRLEIEADKAVRLRRLELEAEGRLPSPTQRPGFAAPATALSPAVHDSLDPDRPRSPGTSTRDSRLLLPRARTRNRRLPYSQTKGRVFSSKRSEHWVNSIWGMVFPPLLDAVLSPLVCASDRQMPTGCAVAHTRPPEQCGCSLPASQVKPRHDHVFAVKMDWSGTGSFLLFFLLMLNGQVGRLAGVAVTIPWHHELCCAPLAQETPPHYDSGLLPESLPPRFSHCDFSSKHHNFDDGLCVDVICEMRENRSVLTCRMETDDSTFKAIPTAIVLQTLSSGSERINTSEDPVICEGNNSLQCSLLLGANRSDIMLRVIIANVTSSPLHLEVPTTPVKLPAPINVFHEQTIEAALELHWEPPPGEWGKLRYEVRYAPSNAPAEWPEWKVFQVFGKTSLRLDLDVNINFSIQIRCSNLEEAAVWSDWTKPHHIHLDYLSYIPEVVKARPGEAVTIYCVFNNRTSEASSAHWNLNLHEPLPSNQYHPVNQWVSQVTVRPSGRRLEELLQCSLDDKFSYSQIYVEGANVDISCTTNGDINEMECSLKEDNHMMNPIFKSRWANVLCEEMERRERAGEEQGSQGPVCHNQMSCKIHPLRMNCYKLWLEIDSQLGPIASRPIYLSPLDHVKPHTPSNVTAVTGRSGILTGRPGILSVTWVPPPLPVGGVQCEFRFHAPTTKGPPVWRVQPPVLEHSSGVSVSSVCESYAVQVRCRPKHSGYWSEWSPTVYSVPQNSQAPERGPDFWRVVSDDPTGNRSTVTLLFEGLQTSGLTYCVDGLKIRRHPLDGLAIEEKTGLKSSYSFPWSHEVQTVSVESYNSLGQSANNFNITLSRVKRVAVHSFHVLVVNSSWVSVSWSVVNQSSPPLSLVLQWTHPDKHTNPLGWKRLRPSDRPVLLRGDFLGSEEYDFYLHPVFADGEGQAVHTKAVRRDAGDFMLLMIISFLSIVLLVTLVLSQNQMKKIVWRDVPNPNKCSWANGVDFRKMDPLEHFLKSPETLPAWPLLLPMETISTVVIMDKITLVPTRFDPSNSTSLDPPDSPSEPSMDNTDILNPEFSASPLVSETSDVIQDSSGQLSVNYATVLLSDPQIKKHFRDGSGCSSCDEGNFSANNSDISDSDIDKRRSGSYNSEEFSDSSDHDDDNKQEQDLYYLTLNSEDSEGEENESILVKSIVLGKENGSCPLMDAEADSNEETLLYLPQFRTGPVTNESQL